MATNTTNYGWTKPDYEDDADIAVLNETFDAIDAQVKTVETALNNKQNTLTAAQLAAINSGITSTDVAQIETNKNNISLLTPTVNDSGYVFTVGTDYTLCDACTLTIPAPANGQSIRVANILASLTFNNSAPRGIILSISNSATDYGSNSRLLAKIESTDYVRLSTQCTFFNYSNTTAKIYVWVKSSTSAINRVISSMQLMN